ncbi:MAG: hypothetical protein WCP60_05065 [bacterium]
MEKLEEVGTKPVGTGAVEHDQIVARREPPLCELRVPGGTE